MKRVAMKDLTELLKGREDWFASAPDEKYRYWTLQKPWSSEDLREAGFSLVCFSASTTKPTGETENNRYTKANPLFFDNGVVVENGSYGITAQSITQSFLDVRVDGIFEMNQVLKETSEKKGYKTWKISRLQVQSLKRGFIADFLTFNPNGIGSNLYIWNVYEDGKDRHFWDINYFEQQEYFRGFCQEIAACEFVPTMTPSCVLKSFGEKSN